MTISAILLDQPETGPTTDVMLTSPIRQSIAPLATIIEGEIPTFTELPVQVLTSTDLETGYIAIRAIDLVSNNLIIFF